MHRKLLEINYREPNVEGRLRGRMRVKKKKRLKALVCMENAKRLVSNPVWVTQIQGVGSCVDRVGLRVNLDFT